MKQLRACLATGLTLTAAMMIALATVQAEQKKDDQKNAAIASCMTDFNLCCAQCSGYSSIPQLMNNCNQDCVFHYNLCISAAARRAPNARSLNDRPPYPRNPRGRIKATPRDRQSGVPSNASIGPIFRRPP